MRRTLGHEPWFHRKWRAEFDIGHVRHCPAIPGAGPCADCVGNWTDELRRPVRIWGLCEVWTVAPDTQCRTFQLLCENPDTPFLLWEEDTWQRSINQSDQQKRRKENDLFHTTDPALSISVRATPALSLTIDISSFSLASDSPPAFHQLFRPSHSLWLRAHRLMCTASQFPSQLSTRPLPFDVGDLISWRHFLVIRVIDANVYKNISKSFQRIQSECCSRNLLVDKVPTYRWLFKTSLTPTHATICFGAANQNWIGKNKKKKGKGYRLWITEPVGRVINRCRNTKMAVNGLERELRRYWMFPSLSFLLPTVVDSFYLPILFVS